MKDPCDIKYGFTRVLEGVSYEEALERVGPALKEQGFGVLTEIDVKETLKKKIDVDTRPYKILGACNPPLAHQAIETEQLIGLLLPCNVVVTVNDDDDAMVSMVSAQKMFEVIDNPEMVDIPREVDARLKKALAAL